MASFVNGVRLESRVLQPDVAEGLSARVRDPLWMLARQWQFGEFAASNAGSPTRVDLDGESAHLTRYRLGPLAGTDSTALDSHAVPLETLVERESAQPPSLLAPRLVAEAGLHFLHCLDGAGATAYRAAYSAAYALAAPPATQLAQLDQSSRAFLGLMAGRVPDARRLYADLSAALGPVGDKPAGALPAAPVIPAADRPKVLQGARAWLVWYADQGISQPGTAAWHGPAWDSGRMEYEFAVGARTSQAEAVLTVADFATGRLDWPAFSLNPSATLNAPAETVNFGGRVVPAPVSFRGMPSPRFWEFEDARLNLSQLRAESDRDIARLLLLEFALVYGNDWFVIPVDVEVGSISRVRSLVVTDSFGVSTGLQHYSAVDGSGSGWRMFALSTDSRAAPGATAPGDLFFLPPALGQALRGPLLEDVLFLRDEMASTAWAVERTVESPIGRPLDRVSSFHADPPNVASAAPPNAPPAPDLQYRLGSDVPDYWTPFVTAGAGWLQRAVIPDHQPDGSPPLGRILEPNTANFRIRDEEVQRDGAHVTRAYRYARWIDGSTHLWIARSKGPGTGEGSSGLRFDILSQAPR